MSDERRHYDSKLSELIFTVGRLEAQMEESTRQRLLMFDMIGEVRDGVREVKGLAETVKMHGAEIEKFKSLKWKLGGAAAVLGAGGASAGWASLMNFLKHPFGGLGGGP